MFAVLGILVSLALLIVLAYRGWNVILLAPICALVAAILSLGDETPLLATYTQVFMPALGNYLLKFFPLFLLGAVFGKLMDDSGCARAFEAMKADGTYQRIADRYNRMKVLPIPDDLRRRYSEPVWDY